MTLHAYVPQDRLRALARGESLPDHTSGSALFADISGFTSLTEMLRESLGSRRGAEELIRHLDAVYAALIAEVEKYGGSVIGFAGDAITCWFDDIHAPAAPRATLCAFALQEVMQIFTAIALPNGATTALALKVAVASGPARRFVVGDPTIHYMDALAGATVARTATAEHLSYKGEVLLDEASVAGLGADLTVREWRTDTDSGERFAVAVSFVSETIASALPEVLSLPAIADLQVWVHHSVYEREQSGQESFLTEFRPCAVLFVRFVGIDYGGDEAATQLDTFIRQAQTIVTRYEGTLLQITIGDKGSYALVALGALSTHEDDARRAVKIALALREDAQALGFLAPLQMGLTQGTMRAGAYGGPTRRAYSVLGDDVNLSARLMQTAAPNEILISGQAQKLVANDFAFEPRPPLLMKGKSEPLSVFAVTGERQQRAIRLQEPTYALPMVGRQAELQIINDKLDLALNSQAQIIGIVAEAGMGKSRLVAEVIRLARKKGFTGYGGVCQSDAINTPYLVWKPIWSAFFDVDPSAPLRKQIRSLEGEIEDRVPERVQALPLLGSILNLAIPDNDFTTTLEPKVRQSALHALLEDCLKVAAKDEPLLIVIEDLHWMDALSHDLLDELARALAGSSICFVLAYRPPQLARLVAPPLEALPQFTKIELSELSAAESEQAIRAKLAQLYPARSGAVPPILVEKLMARAQGNPFFLEELLNFLRDRGLDPRDPDDLHKIELPDSLHTLILSRIDHLSEHEKTTLRVASIIGRLFRVTWLMGYYPALGDLPEVQADLQELHTLDITPLDSSAESLPGELELAYLFKHIVTHEVTYESLPFAMRAQLHEQLAQYLETISAPVEILAEQYGHSHNQEKQREYFRKAGDAAQAAYANDAALNYFTRLLPLIDDPQDLLSLHLKLAESHYVLSNFSAARAVLDKALLLAVTPAARAAVLVQLGQIVSDVQGDYAGANAILAEALLLARADTDQRVLARVLHTLGLVNWTLGNLDVAHAYFDESLAVARALGNTADTLLALGGLGLVYLQVDLVEAERLYKEAHALAVTTGNRERSMMVLINLGEVIKMRGDWVEARALHKQALILARELGARQYIAVDLLNLAGDDIVLHDHSAARAELREGLALARELGTLPWMVVAVYFFADLLAAEGHATRALSLVGMCQRHPAFSSDFRKEVDEMLVRWNLDVATVEAGLAQGTALDFDTTVEEIARELAQSGSKTSP